MTIFTAGKTIVYLSISVLIVVVLLATVDHFLLGEKFRAILTVVGQASLAGFATGIVLVIAAGVRDRFR